MSKTQKLIKTPVRFFKDAILNINTATNNAEPAKLAKPRLPPKKVRPALPSWYKLDPIETSATTWQEQSIKYLYLPWIREHTEDLIETLRLQTH